MNKKKWKKERMKVWNEMKWNVCCGWVVGVAWWYRDGGDELDIILRYATFHIQI